VIYEAQVGSISAGTIHVRGYAKFLKFRIQYNYDTFKKYLYSNLYACKVLEKK